MLKSPVIKAGRQLFRNACMRWEFVQNPCHTWTNIMSMNLIMPSIMKQCWPPLHFFQRRSNCLLCKGARRDEWWLKQMDSYLRHLRGRPSLCALLYLSVHQEHEQCGACRGGRWVMKVSVLYLVTQSRGQLRLPVFFSPELGRTAACRLQSLLSPPTCSLQQGLPCCSEGAEIRSGAASLSSETLAVHIRLLSFRHIPGYWTNWIKNIDTCRLRIMKHQSAVCTAALHALGRNCDWSPPWHHPPAPFQMQSHILKRHKMWNRHGKPRKNIESKSQCMKFERGGPHSQVKKILQEKNFNHNQCVGVIVITWPWLLCTDCRNVAPVL